ncbi:hypothetical protein O0I10_004069 [Lichtheimia ornata]|uniref:Barwin domain-containing protein n=1 Tax=Lichtheimia ornata TaxID=688661 RepID=A0AAD7V759_9FUNG|nr:uncharacterized protein O0I10_004069 [Lichtheimia ornata]KAJ8660209.1 hypothetical protein O0I10_004069 [Lichtheimia ornata]
MKKLFSIGLLFALVAICITTSNTVYALDKRHGTAKIGTFGNATLSSTNKRDEITWYTGQDLKNAACYGRDGLDPFHAKNTDMIGAMAMKGLEQCYQCVKITNKKDKHLSVIVRIVDKCAACELKTHIDLTAGAFKMIAPKGDLDLGVVDITWEPLKKCPKSKLFPLDPIL